MKLLMKMGLWAVIAGLASCSSDAEPLNNSAAGAGGKSSQGAGGKGSAGKSAAGKGATDDGDNAGDTGDDPGDNSEAGMGGAGGEGGGATEEPGNYVVGSLVFGDDNNTTAYVSILKTLGVQTIDYDQAREFSGAADLWVQNGSVFVADGEALTVTKFAVVDGQLSQAGKLGFTDYGLTGFGFWLNAFVAKDKAYFLNGAAEAVIWNPEKMTISGTMDFPELDAHGALQPFPGYSDRAAVLREGKLYQPIYWTDKTYFSYSEDSAILVIDVAKNKVENVISAPCPGLDFASLDDDGTIYFSNWVYAAGAAQVLDQPATCVFQVPASGEPGVAFKFSDVADGHQGAGFRYLGNGKYLYSVLDASHAKDQEDPSGVTFGSNWRFWTYDMKTHVAGVIEGIDWNAGGQYTYNIDGKTLMLVPAGDYSSTTVFDISDTKNPTAVFDTQGWATRLFKIE